MNQAKLEKGREVRTSDDWFQFYITLVPEVFFSLGATKLSGEAAMASREAGRKKPLVPTDNNLTSMPTPISFDWHPQSELILETQQTRFTHAE